ncbi:MAG: asparagine synthase-related protein [Candidatus Thermoplasmatota archaeon]|nr:asparagine synthase-related protein [Candidatus Thermoplasmatota archaeon]
MNIDGTSTDLETNASRLAVALRSATADITGNAALAFSGGLDSSILLYLSPVSIHPYVVGIHESRDILSAMESASLLHKDVTVIEVTEDQVIEAALNVRKIDPDIRITDLGFETVLYLTLSGMSEDILVTGQGADEIFYGYHRFLSGKEDNNTSSMQKLLNITLPREKRIAESMGKQILTPYLEPSIVKYASLEPSSHIVNGKNKIILREAGARLGVPDYICQMEKKAAQYGSGVDRVLRKNKELLF